MAKPPLGAQPQHTAASRRLSPPACPRLGLAALLLATACQGAPTQPPTMILLAMPAPESAPEPALEVRLLFGGEADLDLHVTDPLQETIYFANSPAASGGRLLADRRCGDPAPRREQVVFQRPPPGRYRVGVDFPIRCSGRRGARVPYLLQVEEGGRRRQLRGEIAFGSFEAIAYEFEVQASEIHESEKQDPK